MEKMPKSEHTLRKGLRTAIEMALGDPLDIGSAVSVGVHAADIYATAVRPQKEAKKLTKINVVSWPVLGQGPIREALGYINQEDALRKANSTDGAEIFMLEVQ